MMLEVVVVLVALAVSAAVSVAIGMVAEGALARMRRRWVAA
jgi:hypothetical protein